ncbi:MAG: OadG family protein [Gammaproteobacteria bacterium]|nr:OadG family protein [Gammaproteobacteria bacterium]
MVQENLIEQGLELMLFGMGTVVIFLSALVLATNLMSALVQRFVPPPPEPTPEVGASLPDTQLLAVISAAVHQHRSRRNS